jgi:hypothetical protein
MQISKMGRSDRKMLMFLVVILILFMVMKSNYVDISSSGPGAGFDLNSPNLNGRSIDTNIVSFVRFMTRSNLMLALLPGTYTYSTTGKKWSVSAAPGPSFTPDDDDPKSLFHAFDATAVIDNVKDNFPITVPGAPIQIGIMNEDGTVFNDISTGLIRLGVEPDPTYTMCDCYTFLDAMISSNTRWAVRSVVPVYANVPKSHSSTDDTPFAGFRGSATAPAAVQRAVGAYLSNPAITITNDQFAPVGDYICRYKDASDTGFA